MRAGWLKDIITIQRYNETVDDYGQAVKVYTDLATIRATVQNNAGAQEVTTSGKTESRDLYKIAIRYRSDITTKDRLSYNGKILEIAAIQDQLIKKQMLTITAYSDD